MKSKSFAAIGFAATLLLTSCWLFNSNTKTKTAINIAGKWQIDTVYSTAKDSSKNAMTFFALAFAKDSTLTVEFKDDTAWKLQQDSAAAWQRYTWKDSLLQLQSGTDSLLLTANKISDSLLQLTDIKDSMVYYLSRQ